MPYLDSVMAENIKQYSNGEITVEWRPDLCIHSTKCWKGLVSVFNPRARPWIKMDGSDTQQIIAQVCKCPSGALDYFRNDGQEKEEEVTEVETVVEVMKNGPLLVYGNITVKHKDGTEMQKHKTTAFCRCGQSANKPFCDGTHVKIGFKDE